MDTFIQDTLSAFCFSSEVVSVLLLLICCFLILLSHYFFGLEGLYLYNIIAIVSANIHVLKMTEFSFMSEPVALGTVLFATTFLVSDIITEHYGKTAAKKGIGLSFFAQVLMMILTVAVLFYKPASEEFSIKVHYAIELLFVPSVRILVSSLAAYIISQWTDVTIFAWLSQWTKKRLLWLRTNASTLFSGLIDNFVFSLLAWKVLSPDPVGWHSLIWTYVFGTYLGRAFVAFATTPIIYLSYFCVKHDS
ncbi:MAG: queuosine precursor transporter [Proteobacteria bacterium]|nr:queuosine precursor transporter [Pseudomonadota bacterium]